MTISSYFFFLLFSFWHNYAAARLTLPNILILEIEKHAHYYYALRMTQRTLKNRRKYNYERTRIKIIYRLCDYPTSKVTYRSVNRLILMKFDVSFSFRKNIWHAFFLSKYNKGWKSWQSRQNMSPNFEGSFHSFNVYDKKYFLENYIYAKFYRNRWLTLQYISFRYLKIDFALRLLRKPVRKKEICTENHKIIISNFLKFSVRYEL